MNIKLDFGDGLTREYTLTEQLASSLSDGGYVTFEVCHPNYGEVFLAKESPVETVIDDVKLTQCGCDVCEDKASKLLTWVDKVCNKFRTPVKKHCVNSHKIHDVPNP